MFSAPRAVSGTSSFIGSDKGTRAAALYAITLEEVKNQYLMPAIGFKTSKGTFVHISGTKAGNCPIGADSCADKEKFFLVLTPDNGQSQFARVMDIINVPFVYSGSKDLSIDGEKFTVRVSASLTAPETSVIEITKGASKIFSATLAQMSTALAAKGVDVQLSKAYKLAYGNELLQIKGGAKFTDKMLILMLPFPVVDAASYYILNPSEMTPPAGTSYPSMEAGYKFMISGGVLEISRL